ncbi:MAG TPA: YkgJ family cysteine cluster protein [Fibrobacteria bacterium]|nr:YkgJ family cysteine cluster protein [Fibrobacteria bacterium]
MPEGPVFDFCAPGISEREDALRAAAADLTASLEFLAGGRESREGYEALRAELEIRMPELYRRYDEYVAAVLGTSEEKVACSKGCSHCCSHYVTSVEPYELMFLHGRIRSDAGYPSRVVGLHRRTALFNSLLDGSDGDEAEDRALYRYYLRGTPCPFLSEGGKCGVYDSRPVSCRMFFSMSHPSLCKGKGVIDPGNRNFLIELPEDIEADLARAGAAFSGFALPESLFEGLLRANELFGRFDSEGESGSRATC